MEQNRERRPTPRKMLHDMNISRDKNLRIEWKNICCGGDWGERRKALEGLIEIYFSLLNKTAFEWKNTFEWNLGDFLRQHSIAEYFLLLLQTESRETFEHSNESDIWRFSFE